MSLKSLSMTLTMMLPTDIFVHISFPANISALRNQAPTEVSKDLEQFT